MLLGYGADARILKRQIEERYPSQFGNQFFGNQGGFPNTGFIAPGQFPSNQFNQFPNQFFNQNPNQQQPFNQNQQQPFNQNQQQFNQRPNNQQQFNQGNQNQQPFNQGNQRNPNQGNVQQPQQVTQPTPTQPPTTLAPAVETCRDGCTSRTTSQYNPVCGSDNQNYHNRERLDCAQECGVSK